MSKVDDDAVNHEVGGSTGETYRCLVKMQDAPDGLIYDLMAGACRHEQGCSSEVVLRKHLESLSGIMATRRPTTCKDRGKRDTTTWTMRRALHKNLNMYVLSMILTLPCRRTRAPLMLMFF